MTFTIVQGDTAPPISSRLHDDYYYVDLGNASNVFFHMQDEFERTVITDDLTGRVNIVNENTGEVEYTWGQGDTDIIGEYTAKWEILYDDGSVETFPSEGYVDIKITEDVE